MDLNGEQFKLVEDTVRRACWMATGHQPDAESLFSAVFIKVVENCQRQQQLYNLVHFVARTARREAHRELKRERQNKRRAGPLPHDLRTPREEPDVLSLLIRKEEEEKERARRIISSLPNRERELVETCASSHGSKALKAFTDRHGGRRSQIYKERASVLGHVRWTALTRREDHAR